LGVIVKDRLVVFVALLLLASVLVVVAAFGGAGRIQAKKWAGPAEHAAGQSVPSASLPAGWAY
jgi:hypothetical protein